MSYQVIRYIANKPSTYNGEKLLAHGSIQYTREDKSQAEEILSKLFDISANQKNMTITKRTTYSFRCENNAHKYLFKVVTSNGKNKKIEDLMI